MVAGHVMWATGSIIGCCAGCVILDCIRDATGWAEGVGCAFGADLVGWAALAGTLGAGCLARKRSIHLFLSEANGKRSLTGAVGAGGHGCPLVELCRALGLGLCSRL